MSLDIFEQESEQQLGRLTPRLTPDIGVFDGFIRGTAMSTMRGLAKTGSAIDLLGSVGPIVQDAITGGTEAKDRYFREHDEVWGSAVDYWTPKPGEVGVAGEVTGQLISMLPLVLASPSLAIGATQIGAAEELVKKGVDPVKAQAVGAVQAAGLGLGIYMPIFGTTLAQRVLAGGIGFNVAQGIGMRGVSQAILQDTPGAEDYKALDPAALTLDVLLGAAFGAIVHLSPTQRAEGARMWQRMEGWAKSFRQSDLDAITTLRQAQHLNADSLPGKPVDPVDIDRHVARVREGLEQVSRDQPVQVSSLEPGNFKADPERTAEAMANGRILAQAAEEVRAAEGIPPQPRLEIEPSANLTPEQAAVEAKARAQVLNDVDGQIRAYAKLPDTEGGKIINVDVARELFPDYQANRQVHSPSAHEPASALMKELYAQKLAEPDPNGLNMVTFTAGGTGAGKTTALGSVPLASEIVRASQVIYDTNMAGTRSAIKKIDLALANGKQVNLMYVGTDPVEAFKRALKRAMRMGRTVPLNEHAKTHIGSARAMEELQAHYAGNDRVQFVFLDNGSAGRGDVTIVDPAQSREYLRSLDFDNLEARLKEVLDAEYKAGRISEAVYRGTQATAPSAEGATARPGSAAEPAGGRGAGQERAPAPREELDFKQKPGPDDEILVFRLGNEGGLENRNAGNSNALGLFLQRLDDIDAPQPAGRADNGGQVITGYRVKSPGGYGLYSTFDKGKPKRATTLPGRRKTGIGGQGIEYSFPKDTGWSAEPVVSVTIDEVRAALKAISGLDNFDDAGGKLAAEALRKAFEVKQAMSEASAAMRGQAESPPPRGSARAEAAGAEGTQLKGPSGETGKALTERGTEIDVQYRVVEAQDLVTSHDDALRANPDYPQEVQPRARDRAASETQIAAIENNIRPELLGENPKASDGAPIVGPDGVVESGNARTIALRRAYGGEKAAKYRAWLLKNAEKFGMTRADVENMKQPVLVRERISDVDRAAFAREANESSVAMMGAAETTRSDVARMPELDRLVTNDDGSINVKASMQFIRDFMESVPPSERPALMTADGSLSQAGLTRIRNAVFQRAYGDVDLVGMMAESTDANVKNVLAALMRAAPDVAKLDEMVQAGARFATDFPKDLAKAVRLYSQLRAEGMPVKTFLSQGQMFDAGLSPAVRKLLEMLDVNGRAPNRMVAAIEDELAIAHGRGNPKQTGLFDEPGADKGALDPLQQAARRVVTEQPDLRIRVGQDANGNPITRSLKEFLDDAERAADEAVQDKGLFELAANCLLGGR